MIRAGLLVLSVAMLAAAPASQTRPVPPPAQTSPGRGVRGEDGLVRAYGLILDARFGALDAELRRACGPAPIEACHVLEATALWWRILLDPDSRALDDEFSTSVERAIQTTEAWTIRAPDDAEAWFYVGGAYAARVQWRVLREERLAAARDGKRIKDALERALARDPGLDDAYFGIGMYRYYADVAPAAAKILRFLLLLPGGDRHEGLTQMLRARTHGRLLQGEADYQLHVIYLWYEHQTGRALELLRVLQRAHPGNPLFLTQIAEIQDVYQHDGTASLESWRMLLAQARADRVYAAGVAEVRAHLGIARHLDALALTDEAIDHLDRVVALKPDAPQGSLALAYLRLGEAHDRLNARADAVEAYRAASRLAPPRPVSSATSSGDRVNIRREAAERLGRTPNAQHAEAFRLSLEGWRELERNDVPAAAAALERAIALNPRDPVARYRYGRVLEARRDDSGALAQFALTIREARLAPAPLVGETYLETARIHERAGRRDEAVASYQMAANLFGAGEQTHRTAARALARLMK
jgi:tetratricopeptide (TPR) repeat protein